MLHGILHVKVRHMKLRQNYQMNLVFMTWQVMLVSGAMTYMEIITMDQHNSIRQDLYWVILVCSVVVRGISISLNADRQIAINTFPKPENLIEDFD